MYSITVTPGALKQGSTQPARGFKGLTVMSSNKQVIEAQTGWKGFTVEADNFGSVVKIVHYR